LEGILVTGGAGFIGSYLTERLVGMGHNVKCLDNLSRGRYEYISHLKRRQNFRFLRSDILNKNALEKAFAQTRLVFHLAAKVGVKYYVEDPEGVIRTNIQGTENLLELARKKDIDRFVFASTSEVYGKNSAVPLREDSDRVLGPASVDRWCYAASKSVDEHLCNAYSRMYRLPIVILRYFNIYGPRQDTSDYGSVVSILIRRALNNKNPLVHGTGTQTRSFTYIDDTVEATLKAARVKEAIGETINIGNPRETTINELARLVIRLAGKQGKLKPQRISHERFYGAWYEDIPRRAPDITKAREILEFQPKTSLEEGLVKTIEWYRRQLRNGRKYARPGMIR